MSYSKHNTLLLSGSIFKGPLSLNLRITFVLGIGILPNLFNETQRLLDPLLLCIAPAWSFYLIHLLFPVLRNPRKSEWHSALCLSYEMRKQLAKKFITFKLTEGAILQSLGLLLFSLIYLIKIQKIRYDISLQIAILSFVSIFLMVPLFTVLLRFADNLVLKKDSSRGFTTLYLPIRNMVFWNSNRTRSTAIALSFFYPRLYRPLIRRHWLYLIRSESIILFIISFVGLTFGIFNAMIIAEQNILASAITLVYCPLILFFFFTRTISESNSYLFNCEYYNATARQLYISNLMISTFWILPYVGCFLYGLISSQGKLNNTLIASSGLLAFVNIVFFIAYRWSFRNWSSFTKCLLIVTVFVCFIAISGSINESFLAGILIPLITLLIYLYLGLKRF